MDLTGKTASSLGVKSVEGLKRSEFNFIKSGLAPKKKMYWINGSTAGAGGNVNSLLTGNLNLAPPVDIYIYKIFLAGYKAGSATTTQRENLQLSVSGFNINDTIPGSTGPLATINSGTMAFDISSQEELIDLSDNPLFVAVNSGGFSMFVMARGTYIAGDSVQVYMTLVYQEVTK